MDYRREIDGLRALAVLPVILFHAGFETFSGGFVGVDVFFVISGYLITTIILTELKQGKFSILNFYERRATDVFEHVSDPLQLVYETAQHLRVGAQYLIANCFFPVIRCHLPQTFHFRYSWDKALFAMGLEPMERVAYGRAYVRCGELNLEAARRIEQKSLIFWRYTRHLPVRLARPLSYLFESSV